MTKEKTIFFIILYIFAMIGICFFVLSASNVKKPDITNIVCEKDEAMRASKYATYESIAQDSLGNTYLLMSVLHENNSYVIKFDHQFNQVAWYRYPYITLVYFSINPQNDNLQFFRGRFECLNSYNSDGVLLSTEYIRVEKETEYLENVIQKYDLQSGEAIEIQLHKMKFFSFVLTNQGETVRILLANQ